MGTALTALQRRLSLREAQRQRKAERLRIKDERERQKLTKLFRREPAIPLQATKPLVTDQDVTGAQIPTLRIEVPQPERPAQEVAEAITKRLREENRRRLTSAGFL